MDEVTGLTERVAACFTDHRDRRLTEHSVHTLVKQRIVGLALGYEDLSDHDELRHDPVLALLADKIEGGRKGCAPLAGKSTLNRLEHAPPSGKPGRYHRIEHDAKALQAVLLESFIDSWGRGRPPEPATAQAPRRRLETLPMRRAGRPRSLSPTLRAREDSRCPPASCP